MNTRVFVLKFKIEYSYGLLYPTQSRTVITLGRSTQLGVAQCYQITRFANLKHGKQNSAYIASWLPIITDVLVWTKWNQQLCSNYTF